MFKRLNVLINKPTIRLIRKLQWYIIDAYNYLFADKSVLIPPRRFNFIGDGDFVKIGNEFLQYFIDVGGLKNTDKVLDVGCGIGRMALPLSGYLSKKGSYEGFDIVPKGINWCTKNISAKFPNFNFQLADIYNKAYHPNGNSNPADYKFPFEKESFDFIFLTSVFTHMLPSDVENYLSEISRVLKKDGVCFITYFILNKKSLNAINEKKSFFSFKHKHGKCYLDDKSAPENAIAYTEDYLNNIYLNNSLKITHPLHLGSWSGRSERSNFQDIVVATKN